jgi:hypothetical protein
LNRFGFIGRAADNHKLRRFLRAAVWGDFKFNRLPLLGWALPLGRAVLNIAALCAHSHRAIVLAGNDFAAYAECFTSLAYFRANIGRYSNKPRRAFRWTFSRNRLAQIIYKRDNTRLAHGPSLQEKKGSNHQPLLF